MLHTLRMDKSNREFFKSYIPPGIYAKLDRPDVLGIGAAEDTTAISVMVVEVKTKAVIIQWLFVTTVNRRRGVGTMLLEDLAEPWQGEAV